MSTTATTKHSAIVFASGNRESLEIVHQAANALFDPDQVTEIVGSLPREKFVNARPVIVRTFMVAPNGIGDNNGIADIRHTMIREFATKHNVLMSLVDLTEAVVQP